MEQGRRVFARAGEGALGPTMQLLEDLELCRQNARPAKIEPLH
jgi:hypothetical protein